MTSAIVYKYKLTTELCVCNCFGHFIWFIAPEKIIIEKSGWGYNIYLLLKLNFLLLENPLKTSFCTYNQHQSIINFFLSVESKFIAMQLKFTNLKLCITGDRGSNKEISFFLDSENCSNFRLIQHNNDYDIQVQKNLFF